MFFDPMSDPLVNLSVLSVLSKYFILVGGLQLPGDVWSDQRYWHVSSAKRLLVHLLFQLTPSDPGSCVTQPHRPYQRFPSLSLDV